MELTYMTDPKGAYAKRIMDGLVEFNLRATGSIRRERRYIYVFSGENMVSGATISFGWDWVHLLEYFYAFREALFPLLSNAFEAYEDEAIGSILSLTDSDMVEDFEQAGFKIVGRIKDIPKGGYRTTLANRPLHPLAYKGDYRIISSTEPIKAYDVVFKEKADRFAEEHALKDRSEKRLSHVCLDQDVFVGGVVGKIEMDNLYVDLLFVDRDYRKKGIAKKLMELIEQEAKENDITQAYLGTGSFQAPGLYQKLGYEIVMTVEDFPRNFSNHTLVKVL